MLGTIPENLAMACIFVFEKYLIKLSKTRSVQLGVTTFCGPFSILRMRSAMLLYGGVGKSLSIVVGFCS